MSTDLGKEWKKGSDILSDEEINNIMDETMNTVADVDESVVQLGPLFVDEKLFDIHTKLQKLEKFLSKIKKSTMVIKRAKNLADSVLNIKKQEVMLSHPKAKDIGYQNQKESFALSLLKDNVKELSILQDMLITHATALDMVENQIKYLKESKDTLKIHLRILESRIRLGEVPASSQPDHPLVPRIVNSVIPSSKKEDLNKVREIADEDLDIEALFGNISTKSNIPDSEDIKLGDLSDTLKNLDSWYD